MKNPKSIIDIDNATATMVATIFDVSNMSVTNWVKRNKCPKNENKRFNLKHVAAWRVESVRERAATDALIGAGFGKKGSSVPVTDADGKLIKNREYYQTKNERLKSEQRILNLDERRGLLVPADKVHSDQRLLASYFKESLLNLPPLVASQTYGMEPREIQEAVESMVIDVLNKLCTERTDGETEEKETLAKKGSKKAFKKG